MMYVPLFIFANMLDTKPQCLLTLSQSMEATLTGRNGLHAVAPVDKASKNESDYATTQNQPMAVDHAAVLVSTPGNVKLASARVRIPF